MQVFNECLETLNLKENDIGDDGAKALAKALEPRQQPDGTWVSVCVLIYTSQNNVILVS